MRLKKNVIRNWQERIRKLKYAVIRTWITRKLENILHTHRGNKTDKK